MSQYTTPIGKPSLFEPLRPANIRHPLTPPETDFDYVQSHPQTLRSAPAGLVNGIESEPAMLHLAGPTGESSSSPYGHRRGPSVSYIHSGIRESRERVIQRSVKWLVMVSPPASFTQEHGQLGSTLSSGPSHRLSHGILLPLYPTMAGQLGVIAREFSLPSIAGLCLYLNTVSGSVAVTPRISEESWSLLWAHFLDIRNPVAPQTQLPVCGRIEFDIDFAKARWYDAWLSVPRRDVQDVPVSVIPSRDQTLSHWRDDSRTTVLEDNDDPETASLLQQNMTRAIGRNGPKKLSLVDRFDLSSVKSGSKLVPRHRSPTPTEDASHRQQSLSPIAQEEEPMTARRNLDQLITNWRASASQAASPLAATGQTSLDPANMPNTSTLVDTPAEGTMSQLNLDDFSWSVSSVGPPEYEDDIDSLHESDYNPSVHLVGRLQGSVLLTPSTHTSFGPPDYDMFSPISYVSRLPSPDIAARMLEDCPPTPSTCTSWGGAELAPNSPYADSFRAPSVDLAHRGDYSRPVTPTTATTWGAMDSYPPSPRGGAYSDVDAVRTPDAAERSFVEVQTETHHDHWGMVWPYYHVRRVELPERWEHVWPYTQVTDTHEDEEAEHRGHASPYISTSNVHDEGVNGTLYGVYPYLSIYPAVYPSFELYPAPATGMKETHQDNSTLIGTGYPSFNLYAPVYPHMNIYPATTVDAQETSASAVEPTSPTSQAVYKYPDIIIYAPVYPYNLENIYSLKVAPFQHQELRRSPFVDVTLKTQYPIFDLYPSTYPHNLLAIYHSLPITNSAKTASSQETCIVTHLPAHYPAFNLYMSTYPHNLSDIYPSKSIEEAIVDDTVVSASYISKEIRQSSWGTAQLLSVYPLFNLYPAVYPANLQELYPTTVRESFARQDTSHKIGFSVVLSAAYPAFDLYAPVYPHNLEVIYPVKTSSAHKRPRPKRSMSANLVLVSQPRNPRGHGKHTSLVTLHVASSPSVRSPIPPVPPLPQNVHQLRPISPWTGLPLAASPIWKSSSVEMAYRYPVICLYHNVYPYIDMYPGFSGEMSVVVPLPTPSYAEAPSRIPRKVRKHTHADLYIQTIRYSEQEIVLGLFRREFTCTQTVTYTTGRRIVTHGPLA
ncbi:hypothetical protein EUX98_g5237 [Antrodiella citrinella]|uniref:Uncharacterized protein n=1 Tax=Antrodiella citrinella TaxID=2447956 RepID=A0A4S4MUH2_9APHY|nr:hypothetical protein EUX98_g5237 [Antrodiella citrinella]